MTIEVRKEQVDMRNVKKFDVSQRWTIYNKGQEIKIGQVCKGHSEYHGFCLVGNGKF